MNASMKPGLGIGPIRVRSLEAGYGTRTVLRGVSVELPAGCVSVLTGPGGGGKTTLVRALLGAGECGDFWQRGKVDLPGPRVSAQRQSPASPGAVLGAILAPGVGEDQVGPQSREALCSVWLPGTPIHERLEPLLGRRIESLSRWHHRLTAFTRALSQRAELYVFDEPDADVPEEALDPIAEAIRHLPPEATVLVVTHNLTLARQIADFVVLMIEGKVVEAAASGLFFDHPARSRTRDFVEFGG